MNITNLPSHINDQIIKYLQVNDDLIIKYNIRGINNHYVRFQIIAPVKLVNVFDSDYKEICIRMKLLDIVENVFLIETDFKFVRGCFFAGNYKIMFGDGITCIHLAPEANNILFNYLYEQYPSCPICNKNFNISMNTYGIKNNDQIIKLSHSDKCQCKKIDYSYRPINIHENCMINAFITCPGNGKQQCNNKLINTDHLCTCSICDIRTCMGCTCEKNCEECNKSYCSRNSYHDKYCDDCSFKCEICNYFYNINDMCSCRLCNQHKWCDECASTNPIILKLISHEDLLNIICIQCNNDSTYVSCKNCKNICIENDLGCCNDCNNQGLCTECLIIVYRYDNASNNLHHIKVCAKCNNNYEYKMMYVSKNFVPN